MPDIMVPKDVDKSLKRLEKDGLIKDKFTFIWDAVREKIHQTRK